MKPFTAEKGSLNAVHKAFGPSEVRQKLMEGELMVDRSQTTSATINHHIGTVVFRPRVSFNTPLERGVVSAGGRLGETVFNGFRKVSKPFETVFFLPTPTARSPR